MNIFKKIKIKIRAQKRFLRESKSNRIGSLWNNFHGFFAATIDICGITKDNYKDFLSDRDYWLNHPYNGPYTSIIDNKLWLPFFLHEYKAYLPKYYLFKDERGFLKLDIWDRKSSQYASIEEVVELIRENKKIAAKHTHSSGGNGFYCFEYKNHSFFINHKECSESKLKTRIAKLNQYIFIEYIKQHDYSSQLNDSSLNTIRLLTYWDYRTKEFCIHSGFHRFGCNNSVVDNIGGGNAILSFIDVKTGKLTGCGEVKTDRDGDKYMENIIQPNSHIPLTGLNIPHFEEMSCVILEMCNRYSFMKYMGWDIAITADSFKVVEINSMPSLDVVQQRSGFLLNDGIKHVIKK